MYFFEIFAECSIAFAGFGAVHAVLQKATSPRRVLRAWTVVAQGALAFVLSIIPLLLSLTSLPDELLWRYASSIGLIGASASTYSFILFDIRMTRAGYPPQATLSIRTAQLLSITSIIVMLANLIGWPWQAGPFLYAVALTIILITGLIALLHSFILPVMESFEDEGLESSEESPLVSRNNK